MNAYMVWYRLESEDFDRVRGIALNWKSAEQMADNLDLLLRSLKIKVVATGVKRAEHGKLYDDEECSLRWSVVPPEQEGVQV